VTVTINPAPIPPGTELSFGTFQLAANLETAAVLINTGSRTLHPQRTRTGGE
jgi:hypothetical protein